MGVAMTRILIITVLPVRIAMTTWKTTEHHG